ncbi:hypothetical protein PTKIN_Ptkin16aG0492600 [Pterospermum kingtungense]
MKLSTPSGYRLVNLVFLNKASSSEEGGYVKGFFTYMVMDDLEVQPMSTISALTMLNNFDVKDIEFLREKVVDMGIDEDGRYSTGKREKILKIPFGTLYESIEKLSDVYMQPLQDNDTLLKPKVLNSGATNLPQLHNFESSKLIGFYKCPNYGCVSYIAEDSKAIFPQCKCRTMSQVKLVETEKKASFNSFSYTSTSSSSIAFLNRFNIKDIGALEEKTIKIGMDEAAKLLNASLQSKTVLTDVFLGKKANISGP